MGPIWFRNGDRLAHVECCARPLRPPNLSRKAGDARQLGPRNARGSPRWRCFLHHCQPVRTTFARFRKAGRSTRFRSPRGPHREGGRARCSLPATRPLGLCTPLEFLPMGFFRSYQLLLHPARTAHLQFHPQGNAGLVHSWWPKYWRKRVDAACWPNAFSVAAAWNRSFVFVRHDCIENRSP